MPKLAYLTTLPQPDDENILESIYTDVSRGMPLRHAAVRAGISEHTAYHWMTIANALPDVEVEGELGSHALFRQTVKEADAECVSDRLKKSDSAEGNNWQKHITVLERRFPQDFGRNQRIDITETRTITYRLELGSAEAAILARIAEISDQRLLTDGSPSEPRESNLTASQEI